MACKDCFILGFFIASIFVTWINIIIEYFCSRDKDINKYLENKYARR